MLTLSRMIYMLRFVPCFLFLIRDSTELQRTDPLVLFWFFDAVDLEKYAMAINSSCFRSFACVKNTTTQAHRTPPVPHSGSHCAPSSRVPEPRFSAPETCRGPCRKKNHVSCWPEPSRSEPPTGSVSSGSFVRVGDLRVSCPCAFSALCSKLVLILATRSSVSPTCGLRARVLFLRSARFELAGLRASPSVSSFCRKAYHLCVVCVVQLS